MKRPNNQKLKKIRQEVFERDNYTCQRCFMPGSHAHHVNYKSRGGLDIISNLVTLCTNCHREVHEHNLKITYDGSMWFFQKPKTKIIKRTHEKD